MKTTREFLAAVKARHQLTSDYQLAKFLGLSKQRISANMAGAVMTDEAAIKVADALNLDRAHVMAIIAAERAKTEDVKKAWQRAAAATAAGFFFIALALPALTPAPDFAPLTLHIMLTALAVMLARAIPRPAPLVRP